MNGSKSLWAISFFAGMFFCNVAIAQRVIAQPALRRADNVANGEEVPELLGGTADQWMKALFESTVDEKCAHLLDRLSYFYLTPAQIKQISTVAEREQSDSKRVTLWHAIRMSHDTSGRDYLIHILVEKSSAEMQIRFLETLRNPSRFDLPILVALYNSHSTRQNADKEVLGDVFNVPLNVLELVCQSDWKFLLIDSSGSPFRNDENVPEEFRLKRIELERQKSEEAEFAQDEMVYWLVKNGFDESHRISAFEKYSHTNGFIKRTTNINVDYGREFLKRLETSEGKAKAVWLVSGTIDPIAFIADEAEVVRLSAIETMRKLVTESRRAPTPLLFLDRVSRYKPILEKVRDSDASPDVIAAAKRLQQTILEYEKQNAADANGVENR